MKGKLAGGGHFFYPVVAFLAFLPFRLSLLPEKFFTFTTTLICKISKNAKTGRAVVPPRRDEGGRQTPLAATSILL